MTGIFSGRFDPPNLGHVLTIQRLLTEYDRVIVPILHYSGREGCSASDAQMIFTYHFAQVTPQFMKRRVQFVVNDVHFGKIAKEQFDALIADCGCNPDDVVYLAGNEEVLKNIKSLGIACEFVPRVVVPGIDQYLFESTKIRAEMKRTGKTVSGVYNLCGNS